MAGDSAFQGTKPLVSRSQFERVIAKLRDWTRFGMVGASGLVVNEVLFLIIADLAHVYYLVAAVFATVGSSTWNFLLADRWAFSGRRLGSSPGRRYLAFLGINFALLPARIPILWLLTDVAKVDAAWSNLISLVALFAVRLLIADQWLWRSKAEGLPAYTNLDSLGSVPEEARHHYDVAGLLAIESDVELRELTHFAVPAAQRPDIRIRVAFVGSKLSKRVTFEERDSELLYREHLGPLAANFAIKMGDPIDIRVSPALALSPHVVYTNIVEAFLRFLLVSKGYVLLHSAGLADANGAVTLLSAQTDTGKTSTVISLVRSQGYRFLSDDMTIIDPRGYAISYPKPMTLSFHTMGVAKDGRLTRRDRLALAMQSRLHSKSGRTVGRALGERNLPIMTINSAVQFLVPPPKHRIESLFECVVGGRGQLRNVVLMERGERSVENVALAEMVAKLIENTDDAYGFPPFSTFAPHIRIGNDDYSDLRRKEAELLMRAIGGAQRWRISTPGHEWAEVLPSIIDGSRPVPASLVAPGRALAREAIAVFRPIRDKTWAADGRHTRPNGHDLLASDALVPVMADATPSPIDPDPSIEAAFVSSLPLTQSLVEGGIE